MEGRIKGSWPGGPKREGEGQKRTGPPRLKTVEQIEARKAARTIRTGRSKRQRRTLLGLVLCMVVAGGLGWTLGLRSHASLEEINAELAELQTEDPEMSAVINQVMMELWRMEDVEYTRNRSGR